ncbi:hypothetical protein HDU92_000982 [Lobulomyces angularis]|nr:hypothetical protein HDU92_000982 [Lobulomyces angularis]
MENRVFIVGVGTTKFEKPLTKNWEYYEIGREAGEIALNDARLKFDEIKAAVCSYCYGEPTCGQRAVYELGMTGIPIFNCNNNCSSGSSALMLASSLIKSNEFDCVLALGFEKSGKSLEVKYTNLEFPGQKHFNRLTQIGAQKELVSKHLNYHSSEVLKMFSYSAGEFINRNYNATNNFDTISFKNHKHSKNNENALLQKEFTLEEIKNSPKIFQTVSALSSAPIADGGAAAILCSFRFMMEHGLQKNAVEILSQKMATDTNVTFTGDYSDVCGFYLAKKAANDVFKETNLKMRDVDVLEIHDAFSSMEVQLYAQLGLCKEEETNDFINSLKWVKNENGGEIGIFGNNKKWWCVNPSGGLESKGHPLGATGIAQCAELCLQLRNNANKRQVPGNPKIGLQHNYGLASACVVSIYRKFEIKTSKL